MTSRIRARRDRLQVRTPGRACLGLLLIALLGVACTAKTPFGPVEVWAAPPDLRHIPLERVRSSMWVLAAEVRRLDDLLADDAQNESRRREAVRLTLERMQVAARAIDEPGRTSQHPLLNRFLGRFVDRLERAERGVRREPPNYYLAGTVSGACLVCHTSTQVAASQGH